MKCLFVLAATAILLAACDQPSASPATGSVSIQLEKNADGLSYAPGSRVPYTGEVIAFSGGTTRRSVESYLEGKPHGQWTRFWGTGGLRREDRWERGSLVHQRQWYEDGGLKQDTEIQIGDGFGKTRFWWPDGRIRRIAYVGPGLKNHGQVLEYAEDGSILTDAIFQHGQYVSGKLRAKPFAPDAGDGIP